MGRRTALGAAHEDAKEQEKGGQYPVKPPFCICKFQLFLVKTLSGFGRASKSKDITAPLQADDDVPRTLIPGDLHDAVNQAFAVASEKPYACEQALLRVTLRKQVQRDRGSVLSE